MKTYAIALLSAFAALLIYGGWAVFANFEHGQEAYLMAGMVQGSYAFVSTLTFTASAQWLYDKNGRGIKGISLGFLLSFVVMLSIPLSLHSWVGTPDVLQTILPGMIWGSFYLLGYLLLQEKVHRANQAAKATS